MLDRPIPMRAVAAVLAVVGALAAAPAMAKPEWAKPFLELPTPSGAYIARNDVWVVVYGEVEFGLTDTNAIVARTHLLLENLSDRPESFTLKLFDDESEHDLQDPALYAQRTIWHRINVTKKAASIHMKGGEKMILTSVEDLEPHKRVVMEYALVDKIGFFAWTQIVPGDEPIARIRYMVDPESAKNGLTLELHSPSGATTPASFTKQADGSYTVASVPAWHRIGSKDLLYQPETHELYPYFVARVPSASEHTLVGFARRYRTEWNKRVSAIDKELLKTRAASLAGSAESPAEKAARLAAYVQHDVQYDDSNEQSLEAWLPLGATESLRSLKADCKGKVMLLQALLREVGIESSPILLHVGPDYSVPGDWAGNFQFNHTIMAVALPGETGYGAVLQEGPAKGMTLFDPTWPLGSFGRPLPGYEDMTALYVGDAAEPLFRIHTMSPSAASVSLNLNVRLMDDGVTGIQLSGKDGGASPLLGSLLLGGTEEARKDLVKRTLSDVLPQLDVQKLSVTAAPVFPPGETQVEVIMVAPRSLQEMEKSALLPSPFGVAAAVAGLPSSLRPAPPARPDDAVVLAAPWDAKRNTSAISTVVDAAVTLTLPESLSWTPPSARHENRPWVRADLEWSPGEQPNTYLGKLHLELPRGSWPAEERRTRLKVMDELYIAISSPLLFERSAPH